jgi:hypothetical protein
LSSEKCFGEDSRDFSINPIYTSPDLSSALENEKLFTNSPNEHTRRKKKKESRKFEFVAVVSELSFAFWL